ncbi:MAG: phenylacetate--CoA ligase family protein, partial [Bacteroidetes bacterium]
MHIPDIETRPPEEIKKFQEAKLAELLSYLQSHSTFYQELFEKNGIDIRHIKTLEDLTKIPVTTKDDLQQRTNDFLCVPKSKVVDFITTSGTMGEPVTFAMTDSDLDRLAYNEYISFSCANTTQDDIFQLMVTLDKRFMAGMAYFLGLR